MAPPCAAPRVRTPFTTICGDCDDDCDWWLCARHAVCTAHHPHHDCDRHDAWLAMTAAERKLARKKS